MAASLILLPGTTVGFAAAEPAVSTVAVAAKAKVNASLTAVTSAVASGLQVTLTSNAKKVTISYRDAKGKKRKRTVKIVGGTATVVLPAGSRNIVARAKASGSLKASPKVVPTPYVAPVPQSPGGGGGTSIPISSTPSTDQGGGQNPPASDPSPSYPPPSDPPGDTTAPGPVTYLISYGLVSAGPGNNLALQWRNPADTHLATPAVRIVDGTQPASAPTQGRQLDVCAGPGWGTQPSAVVSVVSCGGNEVMFGPTAKTVTVFTRDTAGNAGPGASFLLGAAKSATGAISRISTKADGGQISGDTTEVSFSADLTKMAFTSAAADLVPGDTNGKKDVFVKDLSTGAVTRISQDGGIEGNADSTNPAISPDGTKVAFSTSATNLANGCATPGNCWGKVVRDMTASTFTWLSWRTSGTCGFVSNTRVACAGGASGIWTKDLASGPETTWLPSVFATSSSYARDGSSVAFESFDGTLVPGDTNDSTDVFRLNLLSGAVSRVSVDSSGVEGTTGASTGAISADGKQVVFSSSSANWGQGLQLYRKNLDSGSLAVARRAETSSGLLPSFGQLAAIAADGRIALIGSDPTWAPPVPGADGVNDVFVKDMTDQSVTRVSTRADGTQGPTAALGPLAFSPDGTKIAFATASALVPEDTNGATDIYIKTIG